MRRGVSRRILARRIPCQATSRAAPGALEAPANNPQKSKKSKSKGPRYQVYKGSWSENRFGIRPGCRWDGVGESPSDPGVHSCERLTSKLTPDRGNGFEKKWILAQNAAARREYEGNKMDMEDM